MQDVIVRWMSEKDVLQYLGHAEILTLMPPMSPLWGDKVSMLTHIYPYKLWRNIAGPYAKSPG